MQLKKQSINRDGSGFITLLPEDPEDMWTAYNLIRPTDKLKASAVRRVTEEEAGGGTSSHRVHTTLTIKVASSTFDAQASTLHVNDLGISCSSVGYSVTSAGAGYTQAFAKPFTTGQIAEETQFAKMGQFHTLDLALMRNFTIEKAEGWDSVSMQIVRDSIDVTKGASAWAVVMQEGLAHICVLMGERTVLRQKVESSIPRKRVAGAGGGGGRDSGHEKGLERFYQTLLESLLRQVDLKENLPILLASPGFTAQGFLKHLKDHAARVGNKALMAQLPNFLVTHSSSGHLHALNEVLQSPTVVNRLKDTKYARETKLMDDFMTMLRRDDGKAWYGPKEVELAVERGAVGRGGGVLFVSNSLFRSTDVAERRRWVTLVDRVRDQEGGEVRILSSEHESGKRLEGLGGSAAILTFPIEDLDTGNDEEEDIASAEGDAVEI